RLQTNLLCLLNLRAYFAIGFFHHAGAEANGEPEPRTPRTVNARHHAEAAEERGGLRLEIPILSCGQCE
ncbi:MAG TPA: hypothetical protein VNY04_09290, partial [Chthoniobacterales bacterium]|nr:hypothetical protein [Chthoniobacterales bacterium]